MKYNYLGKTDLKVSQIGLGSMTWGHQNTQEEAFEQMNFSLERGVSFWDTAEIYPVPPMESTYTKTETIIGNWFSYYKRRSEVILATKVAGPFSRGWIRGKNDLNYANITKAIEGSLKRLKTDYIDLYQLHWPSRAVNNFGKINFQTPTEEIETVSFLESLTVLENLRQDGKIRYYGLSNETPWGVMQCLKIAKENNFSVPVSIQNPYNLLNRIFEIGLSEISYQEGISLLAYSPLAFGVLSGKYLKGKKPKGSRLDIFSNHFSRYNSNGSMSMTNRYVKLAQKYQISPVQMALAFINQQPFCMSNLIGATTMDQLKENIESITIKLNQDILDEVDTLYRLMPNPAS